jgi:cyclase
MRRKMFYGAEPVLFARAKYLRNHLTPAEMKLWGYLRTHPLGFKFRRQHPVDIYIVDFYCHTCKLVIEADGNIHDLQDVQKADEERQRLLEAGGLKVLRLKNEEILKSMDSVIVKINTALENNINSPFRGLGGI